MKQIIFVFLTVVTSHRSVSANVTVNGFHKKSITGCGPGRLGSGWVEKTKTECARNCLTKYSTRCQSVMYNRQTRLCTPGGGLWAEDGPPTSMEGDLYLRESCDSYQGFRSYSYGNESTYAALFNTYIMFAEAEAACQCLGGHLFVAKTVAKFDLFKYIISPIGYVWIGLNDIQVEGKFVWVDDGQEIDPVVKTTIFDYNQPDNWMGNSNCAYGSLWGGRFILDDAPCTILAQFVCEKTACW